MQGKEKKGKKKIEKMERRGGKWNIGKKDYRKLCDRKKNQVNEKWEKRAMEVNRENGGERCED